LRPRASPTWAGDDDPDGWLTSVVELEHPAARPTSANEPAAAKSFPTWIPPRFDRRPY
jgi:hypothetical protein